MNIKQKLTIFLVAIVASVGIGLSLAPTTASADCKADAKKGTTCCGGAQVSILKCSSKEGKDVKTAKDSGVWGLMLIALNIMTAGVGILAVGGVVYAAILYASSSDNADQTKKAKQTIKNTAIGIIAYAGMYIALNFLIPGGIFS
jgi:hypothetical protein